MTWSVAGRNEKIHTFKNKVTVKRPNKARRQGRR